METVKSADGTVIAYDRAGDGAPLVVSLWRALHPPDVCPAQGSHAARFTVVT
jgi:hypothetical protein